MVATDLELALDMANVADSITSAHFAAPIAVETKPDGTPVTAADRAVEQVLRDLVRRHRPGDGFLGEEFGSTGGTSRRWIVDAIDGTHNFANHRPQWGTLIGLEAEGQLVVGVASAPAVGRRWWASRGGGTWTAPRAAERPPSPSASGYREWRAWPTPPWRSCPPPSWSPSGRGGGVRWRRVLKRRPPRALNPRSRDIGPFSSPKDGSMRRCISGRTMGPRRARSHRRGSRWVLQRPLGGTQARHRNRCLLQWLARRRGAHSCP